MKRDDPPVYELVQLEISAAVLKIIAKYPRITHISLLHALAQVTSTWSRYAVNDEIAEPPERRFPITMMREKKSRR